MSHMSQWLVLDEPNQSQVMIIQSTTKPLRLKSQLFKVKRLTIINCLVRVDNTKTRFHKISIKV